MISRRSVMSIALIQLGFSALDIFARHSLREHPSLLSAFTSSWFPVWALLQALIVPFQIRLITRHGLGRGVALMNAFSVMYAIIGGAILLHESITPNQIVSAMLVMGAVALMTTKSKKVPA